MCGGEGDHHVATLNLAQRLVEMISGSALLTLGAPNVPIANFVLEGLLVVDPPETLRDPGDGIGARKTILPCAFGAQSPGFRVPGITAVFSVLPWGPR